MSELTRRHIKARWIAGALIGVLMMGIILMMIFVSPNPSDYDGNVPSSNSGEQAAAIPAPIKLPKPPVSDYGIAQAEDLAVSYGLPGEFGKFAAEESAILAEVREKDRSAAGYYYALPDSKNIQNNILRALYGMIHDPYGCRLVLLELEMQNQKWSYQQANEARQLFVKKSPTEQNSEDLHHYIRSHFGVHSTSVIESIGPDSILVSIDSNHYDAVIRDLLENFSQRQEAEIAHIFGDVGSKNMNESAREAAMKLFYTMSPGAIDAVLQETNNDRKNEIMMKDYGARNDIPGISQAIATYRSGGGMASDMRALRMAVLSNDGVSIYETQSELEHIAERRLAGW